MKELSNKRLEKYSNQCILGNMNSRKGTFCIASYKTQLTIVKQPDKHGTISWHTHALELHVIVVLKMHLTPVITLPVY